MKRLLLALLLAALSRGTPAQAFDHTHQAWTTLLHRHVVVLDNGKASQVRYAGFATDRTVLKSYLAALSTVGAAEFASWSTSQQMAFLINAYNAHAIEKILVRYPDIQSIWDFGKFFGNPFKDEFFKLFGRGFSLDMIEHDTLRKPGVYNEPRVHFAVNCASIGCPMLREEAYVADRLDRQLEEQTRRFLSDRTRNRYVNGVLEVSKIFDWFARDWTSGYRGFDGRQPPITSLPQWFGRHADVLADNTADRQVVRAGAAAIRHLEYDWQLNDYKP